MGYVEFFCLFYPSTVLTGAEESDSEHWLTLFVCDRVFVNL